MCNINGAIKNGGKNNSRLSSLHNLHVNHGWDSSCLSDGELFKATTFRKCNEPAVFHNISSNYATINFQTMVDCNCARYADVHTLFSDGNAVRVRPNGNSTWTFREAKRGLAPHEFCPSSSRFWFTHELLWIVHAWVPSESVIQWGTKMNIHEKSMLSVRETDNCNSVWRPKVSQGANRTINHFRVAPRYVVPPVDLLMEFRLDRPLFFPQLSLSVFHRQWQKVCDK